ncbi:Leucine aminopeptidase 1 [Orbilia oligospora]|uniref:Peptide hydrolase n=1 Tax=Orbilia oligospora TaxID=2813651 RepID=A0A6G1M3P8_ORBOL|nr:Leucine aminopeptidase 1 [Orbilia oligospora]KAF3243254.1 Leucine aminopeptidase 1 [Orbilia oligospora]
MSPPCPPSRPIFPPSTIPPSSNLLIKTLLTPITPQTLTLTTDITHLTKSFKTRYFRSKSGREASIWVCNRLKSIITENSNETGGGVINVNASVELFNHSWAQPSVIAKVVGGSDTVNTHPPIYFPRPRLILSSHIDSLNLYLPLFFPAPGANDDASGVAALISIFQIIISSNPPINFKNTLEFHFYSAEETGFWGSTDVFSSYNKMHRDIHSVLQFDMIGRIPLTNNKQKGSDNYDIQKRKGEIGIVNDFLDEGFKTYIKLIAGEYTGINTVDTYCGYACSDHASAIRYGYPGGLLTSGKLEDVMAREDDVSHTRYDTMDRLDLSLITEFVRFGVAWGVGLGVADISIDNRGGGRRGYLCDNGYPDGFMGGVRRFSVARAADPLGIGLWILLLVVMLGIARPWEEVPIIMKMGRMVRRGVRRGYEVLVRREEPD